MRFARPVALVVAVVLIVPASWGAPVVSPAGAKRCSPPRASGPSQARILCGFHLGGVTRITKDGGLGRIAISGRVGAVLQRDEGVVALLDLENPNRPKVVGRYEDPARNSLDGDLAFSKDGKYLFYARQTRDFSKEGIHVLDVEDPSSPVAVSYAPAGGSLRLAYHHDGESEWVVLLDAITGLVVYRFEPTTGQLIPVHVDPLPELKVGGPASAGVLVDPRDPSTGEATLYVTTGKTGLQVFDFSDPVNPVEIGSWSDERGLADITLTRSGGRRTIHAATEYWFNRSLQPQVIRLDASELPEITEERRTDLRVPADDLWRVQDVVVSRGELLVAHSHLGLVALDGRGSVRRVARVPGKTLVAPPAVAPYAYGIATLGRHILVTDAAAGTIWTLRT